MSILHDIALSLGLRTPAESIGKSAPWSGLPRMMTLKGRVVTHSLSALERLPGKHWRIGKEKEEAGPSRRSGGGRKIMQARTKLLRRINQDEKDLWVIVK